MKLSVIGYGYLGAVYATSMAKLGHDVVGLDVDAHIVKLLGNGQAPFFEPDLEELLASNVEAGRLTFAQDFSAIEGVQIHFIGAGTPQPESNAADMTYIDAAVVSMLPHLGRRTRTAWCTACRPILVLQPRRSERWMRSTSGSWPPAPSPRTFAPFRPALTSSMSAMPYPSL